MAQVVRLHTARPRPQIHATEWAGSLPAHSRVRTRLRTILGKAHGARGCPRPHDGPHAARGACAAADCSRMTCATCRVDRTRGARAVARRSPEGRPVDEDVPLLGTNGGTGNSPVDNLGISRIAVDPAGRVAQSVANGHDGNRTGQRNGLLARVGRRAGAGVDQGPCRWQGGRHRRSSERDGSAGGREVPAG